MLHLVSPRLLAVSLFFFFYLVLLHPYALSCVRDQGAPTLAAMVVRREPKRLVLLPSLVLLFSTVLGARPCVPSRGVVVHCVVSSVSMQFSFFFGFNSGNPENSEGTKSHQISSSTWMGWGEGTRAKRKDECW